MGSCPTSSGTSEWMYQQQGLRRGIAACLSRNTDFESLCRLSPKSRRLKLIHGSEEDFLFHLGKVGFELMALCNESGESVARFVFAVSQDKARPSGGEVAEPIE